MLWQQLKYVEGQNTTATNKKSHAAAGAERNDAYLFGHPGGRSKKYRSPQEFFPHLLWLVTDREGNASNCSCKLCFPEKRGIVEGNDDDDTIEIAPPVNREEKPPTNLRAPEPVRSEKGTVAKGTSSFAVMPSSKIASSPATPKISPEQDFDRQENNPFVYRPGELAWFNKGNAWGLAVVCRRQITGSQPQYLLQPLSNPIQLAAPQARRHDQMRPWLAWSVPPTTFSKLKDMRFEDVPWDKVVRGDFREPGHNGDAVVDGSILAARAVDASYSLFDRLNIPTAAGESHYSGMFLGGEKVWIGEPVRLNPTTSPQRSDVLVLIVQRLIETSSSGLPNLTLVGDIYKLTTMPPPAAPNPTPDLPPRMIADLNFRNEVAARANTNTYYEWKLLEPAARRSLSSIRGRWYETKSLMTTIKGVDGARKDTEMGITEDISSMMNSRTNGGIGTAQRKKNRLDSLGGSVPAGLKISKGLNGPPEENSFGGDEVLEAGDMQKNEVAVTDYMDIDQGIANDYYDNAL